MRAAFAASAFIVLSTSGTQASPISNVRLEPLEVRELDLKSGEWRRAELFEGKFFNGWNWRYFERSGSNDDLEVVVTITGDSDTKLDLPLIVNVSRPKKAAENHRFSGLAFGEAGKIHHVIHLKDMACNKGADIEVSLGSQKEVVLIGTDCGE